MIRIDQLPSTVLPSLQHVFAAMKDGQTVHLSISQVVDLVKEAIIDGAPEALDTLNELAAALNDNENFATTITNQINSIITIPVGGVIRVRGTTTPTGFLKENGASISRTTFSSLWSFAQSSGNLATTEISKEAGQFGPGDGSTTFTLPDTRGLFDRNFDDGAGIDTGRIFGSKQLDAFQGHHHKHSWNSTAGSVSNNVSGGSNTVDTVIDTSIREPSNDGVNGNPRTASETRPVNVAAMSCIKY